MMLLCLGIFLGLLTPVHSAPVDNSTHIPVTPVDFINEAVKDGFLLPNALFPSLTTKEPTRNTTAPISEHPSTDKQIPVTAVDFIQEANQRGILPPDALFPSPQSHEESSITPTPESFLTSMMDGSGDFWQDLTTEVESGVSTTLSISPTESSTFTEESPEVPEVSSTSQTPDLLTSTLLMDGSGDSWFEMEDSTSSSISPAQSPTSTDESIINEDLSPFTTEPPKASTTFTVEGSGDLMVDFTGEAGSGHEGSAGSSLAVSEEAGNVLGAAPPRARPWVNVLHNDVENSENISPEQHRGHSTPDWIIIVGFIVGLAALIMLCAAIATRDKWNGPKVESGDETKTNSANQRKELEMQTFLHKEEPAENGRQAEYTVLSVEDLPSGFAD